MYIIMIYIIQINNCIIVYFLIGLPRLCDGKSQASREDRDGKTQAERHDLHGIDQGSCQDVSLFLYYLCKNIFYFVFSFIFQHLHCSR